MPTLKFKKGSEYRLPSAISMSEGDVYFTSDGTYGKIWFADSNGHRVNIVPDIIDGGDLAWGMNEVCCFMPGTKILMDMNGNTKNIEEIQSKDIVISYNIFTNTFYPVKVQKLIINNNTTNLAKIFFDNGLFLEMNEYHPLYTEKGFHSLTNHNNYETLIVGDKVKTVDGWSEIINIERYYTDTPIITYNLATKDFDEIVDNDTNDTFIANGFVVHNAGCPT